MANNSQTVSRFGGLVCVVIASMSALAAYNFSEKFDHNILLDITTFIISFIVLILTYGLVSKFLAGIINRSGSCRYGRIGDFDRGSPASRTDSFASRFDTLVVRQV